MSDTLQLSAQRRTALKKKVRVLREQGIIPGIMYGHGKTNTAVQIEGRSFEKMYANAGTGTLIDLTIDDGSSVKVMIHDVNRHHLTSAIQHVDFYEVSMTETVTTTLPLHFSDESPAVKSLGGTFVKNKDHLTIKCLPGALIKEMTISIAALTTFDDVIRVQNIIVPEGITVLDQPDEIVAFVAAPRTDEELAALNETVTEDVTKVEGVVKPEAPTEAAAEETKEKK